MPSRDIERQIKSLPLDRMHAGEAIEAIVAPVSALSRDCHISTVSEDAIVVAPNHGGLDSFEKRQARIGILKAALDTADIYASYELGHDSSVLQIPLDNNNVAKLSNRTNVVIAIAYMQGSAVAASELVKQTGIARADRSVKEAFAAGVAKELGVEPSKPRAEPRPTVTRSAKSRT